MQVKVTLKSGAVYSYDPADVSNREVAVIEKYLGMPYEDVSEKASGIQQAEITVWLALKHGGSDVKLEDVDFPIGNTKVEAVNDDGTPIVQDEAADPTAPASEPVPVDGSPVSV